MSAVVFEAQSLPTPCAPLHCAMAHLESDDGVVRVAQPSYPRQDALPGASSPCVPGDPRLDEDPKVQPRHVEASRDDQLPRLKRPSGEQEPRIDLECEDAQDRLTLIIYIEHRNEQIRILPRNPSTWQSNL